MRTPKREPAWLQRQTSGDLHYDALELDDPALPVRHDHRDRSKGLAVPLLDHTIVAAHDRGHSSAFVAQILGLPAPIPLGHFTVVRVGETTTLDFVDVSGPVTSQHYAFLVTEAEFDAIFGRIRDRAIPYWADPQRHDAGRINTWDGGRGVYFDDPAGHLLEIITPAVRQRRHHHRPAPPARRPDDGLVTRQRDRGIAGSPR